jgi:uncharacterized SAM-binding protein YcdF (DUF218 family)
MKQDSYLRCRHAVWVWKQGNRVPVLVSGGLLGRWPESAAVVMREMLVAEGVPDAQIWLEDRSTTTYENALYSAEILRRKGIRHIVLVTEAHHMLRSERCFRKQGMDVTPAPCNFDDGPDSVEGFLPDGSAILDNEKALHEFVGLGWYLVRGRI